LGKLLTKIAFYVVMAALLVYFLVSRGSDLRTNVSKRDSIAYWAAARLLLQHQSPYDTATVLQLEREQGYTEAKPLVLRTPPWSLFIVLPLGMLSAFWAWVTWVSLSLAALIVSLRLCWKLFGGGDVRPPGFFWLVGYLFAPVSACLVSGQIGLVLLLGVALFLWLEPKRPFLAGLALILPFAKPHLLALVWLILAFWAASRKHRTVAGGFITALAAATAIALVFDPLVFQHYREMLHQAAIGSEFIPALSGVLRLLFFHRLFWVQFIPLTVAVIWSAWFYRRHRLQWQWRLHGLALMVVSVLATPYAWLTDEVVLLPAVLQVALWSYEARERFTWKTKTVVIMFACLNGLLLLILWSKVPFSTGIYFWSSLVWFGWYVYGQSFRADAR
jgi:Glycosyltransferase family 87